MYTLDAMILTQLRSFNELYYSTIVPFHHIWSRERAKNEPVFALSCPGLTGLEQSEYRKTGAEQQNGRAERAKL